MSEYQPGEGDVEIELHGEGKLWLKPGLGACLKLSRSGYGEPRELGDKCLALNFDAICYVIAAGLERPIDEKLQTVVYQTGTIHLFGKCLRFIHVISNGGRMPKPGEETVAPDPLARS